EAGAERGGVASRATREGPAGGAREHPAARGVPGWQVARRYGDDAAERDLGPERGAHTARRRRKVAGHTAMELGSGAKSWSGVDARREDCHRSWPYLVV